MLSKSKTKKLGKDLKTLGFTLEDLSDKVGRSVPYLRDIFRAEKYEFTIIKSLIDLRDKKKAELEELQEAI